MRIHIERLVSPNILSDYCCRQVLSLVLADQGFSSYDLTLVLTDNRYLHHLNRRFRGIDRTTDVIAFALLEGAPLPIPNRTLGDIYISLPRARSQARRSRVTPQEELARLMIHGVLHLLGYDHIRPGQVKIMQRLEEKYLTACRRYFTAKKAGGYKSNKGLIPKRR